MYADKLEQTSNNYESKKIFQTRNRVNRNFKWRTTKNDKKFLEDQAGLLDRKLKESDNICKNDEMKHFSTTFI